MRHTLLFLICCLSSITVFAQIENTGSISGVITDPASGETLPGVTIILKDKNTVTDMDGVFNLKGIPVGEHTVVFKSIGYFETTMKVTVTANNDKKLAVKMKENISTLNEVVVEGVTRKSSVTSIMMLQKNSITVSDGISGDAIKRSPDKSTGDVLKRISGTTIQNNKFVIIRGLNERYNAAFIDGMPLPSSESDKKAFAFDIFPASLLESISVTKSASPDLPADFSGGIIRINTKSIPDSSITTLSLSQGYVSNTTFNSYYSDRGGKYDLIGKDDGTRSLPDGLAETSDARAFNNQEKAEQALLMKNNWGTTQKSSAPLSLNLQITNGDSWKHKNFRIGYIAGLSYSYSNKYISGIRREFDEGIEGNEPLQQFELYDDDYSSSVLTGLFGNLAFSFGNNHTVNLRNLLTGNSEEKVVLRSGIRDFDQDLQTEEKSSLRSFTENSFYLNQISGESNFPSAGIKFNWNAGRGVIIREIPSIRRMVYTRSIEKGNTENAGAFEASIPTSGTSPSSGGNIFHSESTEEIRSLSGDLSKIFKLGNSELITKAGAYYQSRERDFGSRQYGFSRYSMGSKVVFDKSLLYLPEDKIFAENNMGIIQEYIPAGPGQPAVRGVGGFKLEESTKLNDSYQAGSELSAGFIMSEVKFRSYVRLSGGARLENYRQYLQSFEDDGDTVNVDTTYQNILPSTNLVISPTEKLNIRLSYGQTVSRPEFRELAPFGFFDFTTFYSVRGNPSLKQALVHNYDFRVEYFARRNQMISASVFYKKYLDAIEQINRVDVPREVYYTNVDEGVNYGVELEFRFGLCSFYKEESSSFLNNIFLTSNLAYIKSEVRVDSIQGSLSSKRSLQGQSPYVFNAGLSYEGNQDGISIGFLVNKVGRRLYIVGNTQEPDTYEHSRLVLDFIAEKKFKNRLSVRAAMRDVLSQKSVFYQDINANGKPDWDGSDNILTESLFGATYTVSLSYSF